MTAHEAPSARRGPLRGALAAAVTPLTAEGAAVHAAGIVSLAEFYAGAGLDGLLILGTTGEGVLLSLDERREVAELYLRTLSGRIAVAVHCGAQSTADTVTLARHAARCGATAVAVIPPPYFALDDEAILQHLGAAAAACAPTPFYVYEFAARSGYAVPIPVVETLRAVAPNFAGLKVSDTPFARVGPYLLDGLDVLVGAEALIHDSLAAGAVGAVSGLAAALPELTIAAVRSGSREASERARTVRKAIERFPFHAALKHILQRRDTGVAASVRAPLRSLTAAERGELDRLIQERPDDFPARLGG